MMRVPIDPFLFPPVMKNEILENSDVYFSFLLFFFYYFLFCSKTECTVLELSRILKPETMLLGDQSLIESSTISILVIIFHSNPQSLKSYFVLFIKLKKKKESYFVQPKKKKKIIFCSSLACFYASHLSLLPFFFFFFGKYAYHCFPVIYTNSKIIITFYHLFIYLFIFEETLLSPLIAWKIQKFNGIPFRRLDTILISYMINNLVVYITYFVSELVIQYSDNIK